ncbi:MAG: DUF2934 domain-containing protein [Acidobacteria bacterium]|jgi:hypothetical protein|nr:DUF2934 domain-containing protein [Acidobacteriota bacterium]
MAKTSKTGTGRPASGKASGPRVSRKANPRAPAKKNQASPPPAGITDKERYLLISEAAYYRAEQRGFAPGHELQDWLDAETEVERMLAETYPSPAPAED